MFLPAAETAAPGYTLMLLFSENSSLRICSVRIPDLYNNNIQWNKYVKIIIIKIIVLWISMGKWIFRNTVIT